MNHKSMLEIAKLQATEFADWIWINAQPMAPNKGEWVLYKDKKTILKTRELFDIYLHQSTLNC